MHKYFLSMPTYSRFLLILQLCFGLSLALYFLGYPFTGKLFKSKSDLLIIESVLGQKNILFAIDPEKAAMLQPKSAVQQTLFQSLPENERQKIVDLHHQIQSSLQLPFLDKAKAGFWLLLNIPKLELLWTLLAIVIPILLLLRNPKALPFVWLFPLIALGFAWNNQTQGHSSMQGIFPKDSSLMKQTNATREEWESAWKGYLIKEWAKEVPSSIPDVFEHQAVKGEFFFNLARIPYLSDDLSDSFWEKKSLWILILYFIWNGYFAYKISRSLKVS